MDLQIRRAIVDNMENVNDFALVLPEKWLNISELTQKLAAEFGRDAVKLIKHKNLCIVHRSGKFCFFWG